MTIEWYGKQKTTNGHVNYNKWDSTTYYPETKTPQWVSRTIKSRDGVEETTSKPQNVEK